MSESSEPEFDYQWEALPSPEIEYTPLRISELLTNIGFSRDFFRNKFCLDAGCGTGRWTWAMMQMGAQVESFDISSQAVAATKRINPQTYVKDIMNLESTEKYSFVLCWGVLHHLEKPLEGFKKVASQVAPGGILHIMVYNKANQGIYEPLRKTWKHLPLKERIALCEKLVKEGGGTVHGWWDALNPQYNWSFSHQEIKQWFKACGFSDINSPAPPFNSKLRIPGYGMKNSMIIRMKKKYNINMNGRKGEH
jgi:2-polyprenyl-3-methyl-5-hydroxy-6-metoxy-1,4-benzoquinol methylase